MSREEITKRIRIIDFAVRLEENLKNYKNKTVEMEKLDIALLDFLNSEN